MSTAIMPTSYPTVHQRYMALVEEIECRFGVAHWHAGDVDLWPLARMDLFLDMLRTSGAETAVAQPFLRERALASLGAPLTNIWKSRHDMAHWVGWPKRAHAVMLGDGVSLDWMDGAWQDRYGEPIIAALERDGRSTFLMQNGNLSRLPWRRPTFAANLISVWGAVASRLGRGPPLQLPDYNEVLRLVADHGLDAPSLQPVRLAHRAGAAAASAKAIESMLAVIRPKMAFVTTYYAGLGHAFALACRRHGVLCTDLQHCPQEGTHRAYTWRTLPERGYSTLPSIFWTWKKQDAEHIEDWSKALARPWHRSLHGGHTQLAAFLDGCHPITRECDRAVGAIRARLSCEREILIALQPIGGHRYLWEKLADLIETSPASWRWWIRRHPASAANQDAEYSRLLALDHPNIVIEEAGRFPLPALLRHMNIVISLASGAAGEAAAFGVPSLFLSEQARGPFAGLIQSGTSRIVPLDGVAEEIARAPAHPGPSPAYRAPPVAHTLHELDRISHEYAELCRSMPLG